MTKLHLWYGDAKHSFFHCERLRLEIRNLEAKVGACTFENFCDIILSSEINWIACPVILRPY